MKKVNTIKGKIDNMPKKEHNPQSTTHPDEAKKEDKKDEEHTLMVIDDLDKQVDINDLLKEKEKDNNGVAINLDEDKPKKPKKEYDLDDTIIRDITLSNETHLRLLSNINGYFIDIRKFFRGYPSSKGIRVSAGKFAVAMEYLKKDIEALNLPGLNKP